MSAGAFQSAKYESDSGSIYFCRVQPETLAMEINSAVNNVPAGAIDQEVSASMRGGRRTIGMHARKVSIQFTGTLPSGYKAGETLQVPVLTLDAFNAYTIGTSGTYLGQAVSVVGTTSQTKR